MKLKLFLTLFEASLLVILSAPLAIIAFIYGGFKNE